MSRYLITGASSGIGNETAKYLLEKGNDVVAVARREEKLLEIKSHFGEHVEIFPYDLCDLENIHKIFDFCKDTGEMLDGMVYCAGINRDMPIRSNDIGIMQDVVTVNAFAFLEMGKYFSKKKYSKDSSSIVAVSSVAAYNNAPGMSTYSGSKVMLNSYIITMSKEFSKRGIRVNGIAPGAVKTAMLENAFDYMNNAEHFAQTAIEPIYISYTAEYLLSEKAKYINGAIIPVG